MTDAQGSQLGVRLTGKGGVDFGTNRTIIFLFSSALPGYTCWLVLLEALKAHYRLRVCLFADHGDISCN